MVRAYLPRAMCCSGDRCGRKADRPIDKLSRVISSIRTCRKLLGGGKSPYRLWGLILFPIPKLFVPVLDDSDLGRTRSSSC